ncbi:MAG: hypothetical protein U5R06_12725 [candidate division KSB1 bacterium]|nr:hypothetical protein [candidate division KSB1 bacterium]
MARTIAEIGFDGVDLTVRPGGHVLPENVTQDLPRAVKAIEKTGLKVPMMTTRGGTLVDKPHTNHSRKPQMTGHYPLPHGTISEI